MKKFVLIVNALKDRNLKETRSLCSYINTRGGSCRYLVSVDEMEGVRKVRAEDVPHGTECIVVLGGDGTLIRAARDTVECNIPLIGVNMGTLGYLCELEPDGLEEALDLMLHDKYTLEERMMICGRKEVPVKTQTYTENGVERTSVKEGPVFRALNDIVIHRTGSLSLVSLTVYVNGQYLHTWNGDGIILSTPTGSTGYNMSAGGPIIDPKAQLLLLTPINSHALTQRSIVIDPHDEIVIEVESWHGKQTDTVEVSYDGDHGCWLCAGERIHIRRAQESTKILKISRASFLEILRKKMQTFC
uniref:NAD kinase n=1 Tax=Eubacterium plexicaudatum ASF492 TaxID=1235802 RepID=N2A2P5_9FIRM